MRTTPCATWKALDWEHRPQIFAMAEIRAGAHDRAVLVNRARKLGYRAWVVHEEDGRRTNKGCSIYAGGIIAMVSEDVPCTVD